MGQHRGVAIHPWPQCLRLAQGDWELVATLLLAPGSSQQVAADQDAPRWAPPETTHPGHAQPQGWPWARGGCDLSQAAQEAAARPELPPGWFLLLGNGCISAQRAGRGRTGQGPPGTEGWRHIQGHGNTTGTAPPWPVSCGTWAGRDMWLLPVLPTPCLYLHLQFSARHGAPGPKRLPGHGADCQRGSIHRRPSAEQKREQGSDGRSSAERGSAQLGPWW